MTKRSNVRIAVISVTLIWAVIEWLLLELRRNPYRPPHDMTTFLGTERDVVVFVMGILAIGWMIYLIRSCVVFDFTWSEYLYFGLFLAVLTAIIGKLVMFPWWPVTPNELLWN